MAFKLRWDELIKIMNKDSNIKSNYEIVDVKLSCGNRDKTVLNLYEGDDKKTVRRFYGECLYSEK
jgi:hypothetical protein